MKDPCDSSPCNKGGCYSKSSTKFVCSCGSDRKGKLCEIPVEPAPSTFSTSTLTPTISMSSAPVTTVTLRPITSLPRFVRVSRHTTLTNFRSTTTTTIEQQFATPSLGQQPFLVAFAVVSALFLMSMLALVWAVSRRQKPNSSTFLSPQQMYSPMYGRPVEDSRRDRLRSEELPLTDHIYDEPDYLRSSRATNSAATQFIRPSVEGGFHLESTYISTSPRQPHNHETLGDPTAPHDQGNLNSTVREAANQVQFTSAQQGEYESLNRSPYAHAPGTCVPYMSLFTHQMSTMDPGPISQYTSHPHTQQH